MSLRGEIVIVCDRCEGEDTFEGLDLLHSSVFAYAERDGWTEEGPEHVCPQCREEGNDAC